MGKIAKLQRKIYYKLSPEMRYRARKIFFFPIDFWQTITSKRNKYEPPKGEIYIGSGDFIKQGIHHLELLKKHINLKPEDNVLDIGSGIGRTAVALTKYLTPNSKYEGFDVVEKGVKWCNNKIKTDFPNFNFIYVPLNNDLYNNNNKEAKKFKFPYKKDSFDKVFLFSVFTHMSIEEIANYLCEIKRVLKPGGVCLSTYFIYDDNNEEYVSNNNHFSFPINKENYRLMSDKVKSANIALKNNLLDELLKSSELEKVKVVEGYWKEGVLNGYHNDYQDIVIVKS